MYLFSSFRNIWRGKRKKREMEDIPICHKSVIHANRIQFRLSEELFNLNSTIIEERKKDLLIKNNCTSFEEYITKIINICKDLKYTHHSPEHESIYADSMRINIKAEYAALLKNFQKIISIHMLNKDLLNKDLYLPCFIDNRGRQYYGTAISPTFHKIYRFLYDFAKKEEFSNLENSTFYNKILTYKNLISNFNLDDISAYIILVLMIEVGKFFVKTENCFISPEEFITAGLNNYKHINLEFEDQLYVNKIANIIKKILNNEKFNSNTIIFKDATASGLQNYGILSGYNFEKIKYLNLDGDMWCDTYQYIIEIFLKKKNTQNIIDNKIFLKRKHWKKTIMTIPYNATWYSCFNTFIDSLKKDNINYSDMCKNDKETIQEIHKNFYNDIKYNLEAEFYRNEKNIVYFKYNKWDILSNKEYKINYKCARDKYIDTIYEISEDIKNTEKALKANNMHYRDSELVKHILENYDILPIHDCFGIRLCEVHKIIDKINYYYSNKIGKNIYNIFIIK